MSTHVPAALRRLVERRADGLCEYCLIHEDDTFLGCQIEHIRSEKHHGPTTATNLALACVFCNRHKGNDIATIPLGTGVLSRLFNPRLDQWAEHFELRGSVIEPLTAMGEATAQLLLFNHPDRLVEREALIAGGRYPVAAALARMA